MEALLDAIAARKADAQIGFASQEVVEKYSGYPTLREAMDHADPEDFYCSIESAVRQRYFSVGCMLLKAPQ